MVADIGKNLHFAFYYRKRVIGKPVTVTNQHNGFVKIKLLVLITGNGNLN